jgi:hypothetical protein
MVQNRNVVDKPGIRLARSLTNAQCFLQRLPYVLQILPLPKAGHFDVHLNIVRKTTHSCETVSIRGLNLKAFGNSIKETSGPGLLLRDV